MKENDPDIVYRPRKERTPEERNDQRKQGYYLAVLILGLPLIFVGGCLMVFSGGW